MARKDGLLSRSVKIESKQDNLAFNILQEATYKKLQHKIEDEVNKVHEIDMYQASLYKNTN